jgi:hypothetical protein
MKKLILLSLMMFFTMQSSMSFAESIDAKVDYNGISKYIGVSGIGQKIENNLLILFIDISNKDNLDRVGYYRIKWLDSAGLPAWEEETWKTLLLHGDQKQTFKIVAPTVKARNFRIEFSAEDNFRK